MSQKIHSQNKNDLSAKEKRIKEAVVMHYSQNIQIQEIAKEMGYNRKTIQRYLKSDFAQNLKRVYSDMEIYDLKAQLETEIRDSKKLAENLLSKAIQHEDATPRDLLKAAEQAQRIRLRHIEMLKELGILEENEQPGPENQKIVFNEGIVDPENLSEEIRNTL